jgi:hypothetical protein
MGRAWVTPGIRPVALLAGALALASIAGCGPSDSDYFGPNEPTWVRVPTTTGDAVYVGVLVLMAHPGDTVHLESAVVTKTEGDAAVEPIIDVLHGETRLLGGIAESGIGDSVDLGAYGPLEGAVFSDADGPVAFAVRITGTTPVHGFDGLTIRFRLDDDEEVVEDWIPMRASICTAATHAEAVAICEPIRQQMHSQEP